VLHFGGILSNRVDIWDVSIRLPLPDAANFRKTDVPNKASHLTGNIMTSTLLELLALVILKS